MALSYLRCHFQYFLMIESLHSLGCFCLPHRLILHHNLHLNHLHRHQKVQNLHQEGLDYSNLIWSFFQNSGISDQTRYIIFLLARWSSLPSMAIVIMFILKTCSLFTFAEVSLQDFWNMFIISCRVGWRIFFLSFCSFSSINSISCLRYNVLACLWYDVSFTCMSPVIPPPIVIKKYSFFKKSFFHLWDEMSWIIVKSKNLTFFWGEMNRNGQQWFNVL